jgi:hypothetical protein
VCSTLKGLRREQFAVRIQNVGQRDGARLVVLSMAMGAQQQRLGQLVSNAAGADKERPPYRQARRFIPNGSGIL